MNPRATLGKWKRAMVRSGRYVSWRARRMLHHGDTHLPIPIVIPTYDGSGQSVHPSVLYFPQTRGGHRYWMAFTPYPNGNDQLENPSIAVSNDGIHWSVPAGIQNPLVHSPGTSADYLSDPNLFMHGDHMYMIYREYIRSVTPFEERWFIMRSEDGLSWETPVQLTYSQASIQVSACILHDGSQFVMYFVTYTKGAFQAIQKMVCLGDPMCKEQWSEPHDTQLTGLPSGVYPWHIDVALQPDSGWDMLLTTCTEIGGINCRLHYAYSKDGDHWKTTAEPFIQPLHPLENSLHYKACMIRMERQRYHLWYSAMDVWGKWHTLFLPVWKGHNNLLAAVDTKSK
ncbi:hypothetical protein [Paenibacillus agricola]|uniref:Glycosyl hydrolase family 32 N-terminal domain-containing protein n=1 Tax=Paenibacillus agricola TaxID=2716264 RepID=A0ABX0IZH7_9BACL|nr:hypothetical protein [Paenibacillus agricola]NHN29384.1 hypothetical protein [Paenibacillus agricola]